MGQTAKLVLWGAALLCGALLLFYVVVAHCPMAASWVSMGAGTAALMLCARWFAIANRRNLWRWFGYIVAGGLLLLTVSVLSGTNETPEQAHAERGAREAKFYRHAVQGGWIPPDSQAVICDSRDRIIGYENFERNPVIYDGKEHDTQEACW